MNKLTSGQMAHFRGLMTKAHSIYEFNQAVVDYWLAKGKTKTSVKENWSIYLRTTTYQLGI